MIRAVRRARSLDLNALAELVGWALGAGAFVGAVFIVLTMLCRV